MENRVRHERTLKASFTFMIFSLDIFFLFIELTKNYINANNIKEQIHLKIKFDLKDP